MPKTKISEYSTTNADNTDIEGINIAEGCAPSGINNAIREIMVHLKEFQTGASGDGFTFAGGTLMTGTNTLSGTNVLSGSTTAAFAAGTVSAPSITAHGDTNTGIFFPAADTIAFAEGGAEAMRIDSSGNLGVGVTPSAWSGYKAVEILSAGSSISATASGTVQFNAGYYFDGANKFAVTNNYAMYSAAVGADGSFRWYSSTATGTAGNVATMTERMRIDSSGNVGIGTSSPASKFHISGGTVNTARIDGSTNGGAWVVMRNGSATGGIYNTGAVLGDTTSGVGIFAETGYDIRFYTNGSATERMRIDSSGNVGIGATPSAWSTVPAIQVSTYGGLSAGGGYTRLSSNAYLSTWPTTWSYINTSTASLYEQASGNHIWSNAASGTAGNAITFTERARITSGGDLLVGKTSTSGVGSVGCELRGTGIAIFSAAGAIPTYINRDTDDGDLVRFYQAGTQEGSISVSGTTVSYNSFAGSHWSQLQQGRGYNPEIPRGTVLSSIGEMAEWKSVVWDEVIEHPAIAAVEAVEGKEAVLDEEGNVIEPAVEAVAAVEGEDAWTETIPHREAYLGNLPVGATFTEDGVTKTVVDDGNERLPKVKISDVVGDKAVYGVFQTYDEVQDMLVTALGAFVVRIAAGVTVQIGDLLESNGDGCAKVQDDDVIRSKTIGKVTSTVKTATYADGSYTVPCVLYCG